jgi:hypothetical protein
MASRDTALTLRDHCEDTRAIIAYENTKPKVPRRKGYVRMSISVGGFILEQAPNPEETIFTHVLHADVGVSGT